MQGRRAAGPTFEDGFVTVAAMPPPGVALLAAVDVGGTSIKSALVDTELRVVDRLERVTPRQGRPDSVIVETCDVLSQLARRARLAAAGVVVPGIVNELNGQAVYSANIRWRNVALRQVLAERTGLAITLGHDVRAGALAELTIGAAQGASSAVFVSIGTGIAAAFAVDGRVLVSHGYAGEIGHLVVDPNGTACACGARGCLETIASAAALARRYTQRSGVEVRGAADVCDRVRAGDLDARTVWDSAIQMLAHALSTTVSLLGPEVIVIGGGLAGAGELLLAPLQRELTRRLTFQRIPRLVGAALGDQAGCLGAALLARRLLIDSP